MKKKVVAGIAVLAYTSLTLGQSEGLNLNEFRNWVSSFARYQALAELCTGRVHEEVSAEISGHIDRLYPLQADRLKQLYAQRYARFQKIKKCPAR